MNWGVFLGALTGSLIELVEILAVVLVVGKVAGWRNALVGSGSAIGLTIVVSLILGRSLTLIPVHILEIIAGIVLLAFGQVWTRSAVKYYGGTLKPTEDEDERIRAELAQEGVKSGWNWFSLVTAFKSSLLESVEIAILVVTLGVAGGSWFEAISGALAAAVGLVFFAFQLRAPLNRIPVKLMKFIASMLLMGFGTYWLGQGLDVHWPTGSWAIIWLPMVWGLLMVNAAAFLRRRSRRMGNSLRR